MKDGIPAAGFQNVIEADHVARKVNVGMVDRIPNARLRRQIDDHAGTVFPEHALDRFPVGKIAAGCGVDAPGSFIAWLSSVSPVYAMEMPGSRYDIGDLKSYEEVKKNYGGIRK